MSMAISPDVVPNPRTCLAWDGAEFVAVKCDASGRISVRGENQLFSINVPVHKATTLSAAGTSDTLDSDSPSANEFWVVTFIGAQDETTAINYIDFYTNDGLGNVSKLLHAKSPAAGDLVTWSGQIVLAGGEKIEAIFDGTAASDALDLYLEGYLMDQEV